MKKISTLFKKDPNDLGRVINEVSEENAWVYETGVATRKFDGTSCAIIGGVLYKRYDAKHGKTPPANAIPCQDADHITGHWPHWMPCDRSKKEDAVFFEAFDSMQFSFDGTFELCGPKINSNREKLNEHILIPHGCDVLHIVDFRFESIKAYLSDPANDIEGIVFHEVRGQRMCKIRKSDFGIKR
jgi:hypothetical protein